MAGVLEFFLIIVPPGSSSLAPVLTFGVIFATALGAVTTGQMAGGQIRRFPESGKAFVIVSLLVGYVLLLVNGVIFAAFIWCPTGGSFPPTV